MTENTSGADTSYEQALKSTGIVGGAQFLTILITVVKTKIVALLLGPAGVGVLGLLQGIVDMIRNATGLGIHFSAVKDVAAANASRDGQRIGRTIRILRRWVWGTGLLGMTVAIALSIPLSRFSFGNAEYAVPIVLVSVVLLLTSLQEGQLALLQGLRMIGKMAKAKVAGAVAGFALTVPMYWWLGVKGIVPAMILTAAAMLAISWWFVRGIRVEPVKLTPKETFRGGLSIAKLGFFIVVTTFASTATMYIGSLVRLAKNRNGRRRNVSGGMEHFKCIYGIDYERYDGRFLPASERKEQRPRRHGPAHQRTGRDRPDYRRADDRRAFCCSSLSY